MAKFSARSNHHCKGSPRRGRAKPSAFFSPSLQPEVTISQSNDAFEHEANAIAENIMRTSIEGYPFFRSMDGNKLQKESSLPANDTNQELSSFHSMSSKGNPLPTECRKFFESKFDRDFSNVRVYVDDNAARSADAINAYAYTIGNNIVFNQNQFAPHTHAGKKLLAHELTHVMQQRSGQVSPKLIQRAPVGYKKLSWGDFTATNPVDPSFKDEGAEITTGFVKAHPSTVTSSEDKAKKTKTKCPKPKKGFEYEAPVAIGFDDLNLIQSFMLPDKSWVRDREKTNGVQYCKDKVPVCEKEIDDWAKQSKPYCDAAAKRCDAFFAANPNGTYREPVTGSTKPVFAQQRNQCSGTFLDQCKDAYVDSFQSQNFPGVKVKKDCTTMVLPPCYKAEMANSKRLLQHEQGHFDIAQAIANNARQDAEDRWKKLPATATDCGEKDALKKAQQVYTDFSTEIDARLKAWDTLLDQIQTQYDNETVHGTNNKQQAAWETQIKASLPGFKP